MTQDIPEVNRDPDTNANEEAPTLLSAAQLSRAATSVHKSVLSGCKLDTLSKRKKNVLIELCRAYGLSESGRCVKLGSRLVQAVRAQIGPFVYVVHTQGSRCGAPQ